MKAKWMTTFDPKRLPSFKEENARDGVKLTRTFGTICTALALTLTVGAAAQMRMPSVPIPPERILQNGYSLLPPNEDEWFVAGRSLTQLALVRRGNSLDESIAIQANVFRLPTFKTTEEFVRLIQDGQTKDADPQRFNMLEYEIGYVTMHGTECAKSHMVTEDRAAVKRSAQSGNMILEAQALYCVHPSNKNAGVSIVYSHRHYPQQGAPSFKEKAEFVLNGIEFTTPEPPYFPELQRSDAESGSGQFSELCSRMLELEAAKPPLSIASSQPKKNEGAESDPLNALTAMGISIGRNSSIDSKGSYAIFARNSSGGFTLRSVTPGYIHPDSKNQEVLFISQTRDSITPAFADFHFADKSQAFVCGTGDPGITNINPSTRRVYNPCDSSLTSAAPGRSLLFNALLTFATAGVNLATGSTVSFVDTDKEKVAQLVGNSTLLACLKEANLIDKQAAASYRSAGNNVQRLDSQERSASMSVAPQQAGASE